MSARRWKLGPLTFVAADRVWTVRLFGHGLQLRDTERAGHGLYTIRHARALITVGRWRLLLLRPARTIQDLFPEIGAHRGPVEYPRRPGPHSDQIDATLMAHFAPREAGSPSRPRRSLHDRARGRARRKHR